MCSGAHTLVMQALMTITYMQASLQVAATGKQITRESVL
jgi:hypothetical protein